jgi:hypothetical protein
MALGPGSIAFTGFNADGNDNLSFVTLTDIAAGTVIHFTDNEWTGASFNSGEDTWSWTAGQDIKAGTIVTLDGLNATSATSNLGAISFDSAAPADLQPFNEIVYAYIGDPNAPTAFLSAIANGTFATGGATLAGTGLADGVNAVSFSSVSSNAEIATYVGPRLGHTSFSDYLADINNPSNWLFQGTSRDDSHDGVAPDVPFSPAGFSDDPNAQVVNFAADSLSVSQAEGDSGDTILTFTVERDGGTTGTVSFTGTIAIAGLTDADDFGGTTPVSFTGTIEAGQTSGIVTVHVSGDTQFERNENFTLSLQAVSNEGANAVLGEDTVATATIVNDDPAPANIAFVGFNTDGEDNLAFLAVSDIAAGTVIYFTDNGWNGSGFTTSESTWSWAADSDIAAGTVITMDGLNTGAASSNHGTITFTSGTSANLDENNLGEQIYAYVGTPGQPSAFLTALSNIGFAGTALTGTGLTAGVNALALTPAGADIAYYNGPRTGQTSIEGYLSSIYNSANWIQQDTSADNTNDGVLPELPFPAHPFSTDPTVQVVQFAAGSLNVTKSEGQTGTETAYTFTIERTGGTEGDMTFTVRVPVGTYATAANAADFADGMLPAITGTIPAGASSTTITILVKGENLFEVNERFLVNLESASNPDASSVVIGNNGTAAGTINNDDSAPTHILAGETHTAIITVTSHLTIDQGGSLIVATGDAISWKATNTDVVIDNSGLIRGPITSPNNNSGSLTINNQATGVIEGVVDLGRILAGTTVTLNNAGHIELGNRIDLRDAKDGTVTVNNLAGGVITQNAVGADIMRPGLNSVVNNAGTIQHAAGLVGGGDGVDFQSDKGTVNNYAGGLIEASRHAVTGDAPVRVVNDGTMIGRNGSAVNIDSDGTEAERVFVTNHGRMEGRSANLADSDGDAVDVDGLLTLENYGFIGGMGHNGRHDGEPNVSEGIAVGGGTITNYAGGEIYGYGRAIQVDNSSNANALGTTTIVNAGLIHGDGNLPTGVTPEEVEQFAERIRGGEAINLLGTYADSLTNTGQIIGGVKMGGGDDVLTNSGTMTATGGSAIDMGAGDDTVTLIDGGVVTGAILLGDGNDVFESGNGADAVTGGGGSDTYYYALGDGSDTIVEGAGQVGDADELVLTDIVAEDVKLYRHGDDLEVMFANGDIITVADQFSGGGVESLTFSNGDSLDAMELDELAVARVLSITVSPAGAASLGDRITLTVTLSEAMTVADGVPFLLLNSGGAAFYDAAATAALGDPTQLVFTYTIGVTEHDVDALAVIGGNLNGATLTDASGHAPDVSGVFASFPEVAVDIPPLAEVVSLTAQAGVAGVGDTITLTLTMNQAMSVSGGLPFLVLNNGGTALYDAAATAALGDPAKLVFSYTVGASDHNTDALAVVQAHLGGATLEVPSGDPVNFSGLFTSLPEVDVLVRESATVDAVVASPADAVLSLGDTITLTLTLSEAVSVTGGTPSLLLSDGGTAVYDADATAALNDPTKLVFSYTVGEAAHDVATLAIVGGNLNGATLVDGFGNAPDYAGLFVSLPGLGVDVPEDGGVIVGAFASSMEYFDFSISNGMLADHVPQWDSIA